MCRINYVMKIRASLLGVLLFILLLYSCDNHCTYIRDDLYKTTTFADNQFMEREDSSTAITNHNNNVVLSKDKLDAFIVEINVLVKEAEVKIYLIDSHDYYCLEPWCTDKHICETDYRINCGDGILIYGTDNDVIRCGFTKAGLHTISITGKLHGIRLRDEIDSKE